MSVPKVGFVGLASVYADNDGDGVGPQDPGVYAVRLESLNIFLIDCDDIVEEAGEDEWAKDADNPESCGCPST